MPEDEIYKYLEELHVNESDEENNNWVDAIDTNHEDSYDYDNFFNLSKNVEYSDNLDNVAFNLDTHNEGFIRVSKLYAILSEKGVDEFTINQILNTKGISMNDKITYEDFKNMFYRK